MNTKRFWQLIFALLILTVLLAGCSGGSSRRVALTGASWPGVTEYNGVVYTAFGRNVFATDPNDPDAPLWSFTNTAGRNRSMYAAPAVDDELVVVGDYTKTLFALDRETGDEIWHFDSDNSRFIGSAILEKDRICAGTVDGTLYGLNRDGMVVWQFKAERDIWATPLLLDGVLYVTSLDRHLYAIDAASGDVNWQFPEAGDELEPEMGAIISTPTHHDGVLYFSSLNNLMYALDIESRKVLWTYEITNWMWSPPLVDEESGLVIGGDLDGHVFAVELETGDEVWSYQAGGAVVGTPILVDDDGRYLYFTSGNETNENNLYVLDVNNGDEVEVKTIQGEFTTRVLFFTTGTDFRAMPIYAQPILTEDNVLIVAAHQSDYILYGVDKDDYQVEWALSTEASSTGGAISTADEGEEEQSPLERFTSLLLPFLVAMLLMSLLQRRQASEQNK